MIILGIDPGTQITGYGVLACKDHGNNVLASGCLTPPRRQVMTARLGYLFEQLEAMIQTYRPDVLAIEQVFFAHNAASALRLGECRGIALLAAARASLPLYEYSPRTIKQAVTGSGQASKEQIQKMIRALLALSEPVPPDAADALAVALCHAHSHRLQELSATARYASSGGRR